EILRTPDASALPLIDFDRPVDLDRRWRPAVVDRRGIDDRLDGRTRLPIGLCRTVELTLVERESADHRQHTAGVWIHHHHGAGYFRQLAQPVLALDRRTVLADQRVGIDDIAGRQDLRHRRWRLALRRPRRWPGPPHAVQRDDAGLPILGYRAAEFAAGLQTDSRRLIAGFKHHRHPPRRDVVERFDVGEL